MIVLIAALVLIALFTPSLPYPEAEEPIASWVGATESRGVSDSFVPGYKSFLFGIGPLALEMTMARQGSVVQNGIGGRFYIAPYLLPLFGLPEAHVELYLRAVGFAPPTDRRDIGGPPGSSVRSSPNEGEFVQSSVGTGAGLVVELGPLQLAGQIRTSASQSSLGRWTVDVQLGLMVYVVLGF